MQKRVAPRLPGTCSALATTSSTVSSGHRLDGRRVVGTLGAIAAVLGTAAGLDAEQDAALNISRVVVLAVDGGGAKDQLSQRQVVDRAEFVKRVHDDWYRQPRRSWLRLRSAQLLGGSDTTTVWVSQTPGGRRSAGFARHRRRKMT